MTNTSNKKKKKRGVSIKACIVMLAVVMLLGCAIGSTVAWLTAQTSEVTNTFTYGDINIDLWETKDGLHDAGKIDKEKDYKVMTRNDLKIIPGVDIPKDPTVTVKAGSEKCWLFVKVEATGTFVNNKVIYSIDTTGENGWKELTVTGANYSVYYREVSESDADQEFSILTGNTAYPKGVVTVSDNLKKADVNDSTTTDPTLKFTAYAVQYEGMTDETDAWAKVNP